MEIFRKLLALTALEMYRDPESYCEGRFSDDRYATIYETHKLFRQIENVALEVYPIVLTYLGPINIAANIISSIILLSKELRNPFNAILCMMCFESAVAQSIRASLVIRRGLITEINPDTFTYSLALHTLIEYNCRAPLRAIYTWLAVMLTALRLIALRTKGEWKVSYLLVFSLSALILLMCAAANIPIYMTNTIAYYPCSDVCDNPSLEEADVMIAITMWSSTLNDNDCILYRLYEWLNGIVYNALPSILLLIVTLMLVFGLGKTRKGRITVAGKNAKKNDDIVWTSRMLTAVAILTLLSELPQGLSSLANALFPIGFHQTYTRRFTIVWMIIHISTSSLNLVLTLAMSKNFKNAVSKIFCCFRARTNNIWMVSVSPNTNRK